MSVPGGKPLALIGRWRRSLAAVLLPLLLAACASDAWRADSDFDAFLDVVRVKCSKTRIGSVGIDDLMPDALTTDPYFMDLTSRFYRAKISRESYVAALEGAYMARPDSPGIACVLAQMPPAAQRGAGGH